MAEFFDPRFFGEAFVSSLQQVDEWIESNPAEAAKLFAADAPVEVIGDDGRPFAKGLCRYSAAALRTVAGKRTADLADDQSHEVIHRDDLVVLP